MRTKVYLSEGEIRTYLKKRVKETGGSIRKLSWIGHKSAPDELLLYKGGKLPNGWPAPLVELKSEYCGERFPRSVTEWAQHREHQRLRKCGFRVEVIWTKDQIDALFAMPEEKLW